MNTSKQHLNHSKHVLRKAVQILESMKWKFYFWVGGGGFVLGVKTALCVMVFCSKKEWIKYSLNDPMKTGEGVQVTSQQTLHHNSRETEYRLATITDQLPSHEGAFISYGIQEL